MLATPAFCLLILMFAMGAFSGLMIASNASLIGAVHVWFVGIGSSRLRQSVFLEQHVRPGILGRGF